MCGRARCTLRADDIPRACHRNTGTVRSVNMDRYRPSYNASPGSNLAVVRRDDTGSGAGANGEEGYAIHCMRWGLIPSFTKQSEKPDFFKMFNARSESLSEKASFRRLIPKSRCLVAVEGFYEWKKDGSKKQPYYIHFKDGRPLVLAALYDSWKNSEGEILYTFTIVTAAASSAIQWLHDRMPVILGDKEATDTWLSVSSNSKFDTVLKPYEHSDLVWYPVTPAMGKPSFDGPDCIEEIHLKREGKGSISKFFTRKEFKEESNPEEITHGKSLKLEPNSVKEEYESDGKLETPRSAKTVDYDLKSEPETFSHEGESKCRTKRGHEELVDSKMKTDEIVKPRSSPAKKKANLKSVDDKQPTLLSYFGKK